MNFESGRCLVTQEMRVTAYPAVANADLYEVRDQWLRQPGNKILDDGGRSEPVLLIAQERCRTVIYELVPELTDGQPVDECIAHMKRAGFDVRGQGPDSPDGYPTIMVVEKY